MIQYISRGVALSHRSSTLTPRIKHLWLAQVKALSLNWFTQSDCYKLNQASMSLLETSVATPTQPLTRWRLSEQAAWAVIPNKSKQTLVSCRSKPRLTTTMQLKLINSVVDYWRIQTLMISPIIVRMITMRCKRKASNQLTINGSIQSMKTILDTAIKQLVKSSKIMTAKKLLHRYLQEWVLLSSLERKLLYPLNTWLSQSQLALPCTKPTRRCFNIRRGPNNSARLIGMKIAVSRVRIRILRIWWAIGTRIESRWTKEVSMKVAIRASHLEQPTIRKCKALPSSLKKESHHKNPLSRAQRASRSTKNNKTTRLQRKAPQNWATLGTWSISNRQAIQAVSLCLKRAKVLSITAQSHRRQTPREQQAPFVSLKSTKSKSMMHLHLQMILTLCPQTSSITISSKMTKS